MSDISHIEALFEKYDDIFLDFEKIGHKLSNRPDMHAFLLLDKAFPGNTDLVGGVRHDQIFLNIKTRQIAKLTEQQVMELRCCGVFIDEESLSMFV